MKTRVNFVFKAELVARMKAACTKEGQTMTEFVRRAIIAALEKMKL